MNTPRNIIAIDRVPVTSLTGFERTGTCSVRIAAAVPWQPINIKVPARLTINDKIEDGVRQYTAQLVFKTCEEPGNRGRQAYRCKAADGRMLLIGSPERPYPVGTVSKNHPDNMTDNQLSEVTVTWTDIHDIPIIEG